MKRKEKFKADYNKSHLYDFYKSNYIEKNIIKGKPIYNKLIKDVNSRIIEYLYEGFEIVLPYSLGILRVNKIEPIYIFNDDGTLNVKKSAVRVNWGETLKLWRDKPDLQHKTYIYHENYRTHGYFFKIAWLRPRTALKGLLRYYKFIPSRSLRLNFNRHTYSEEFNLNNYFTHIPKKHNYDNN